jgi:hypothetical protein
MAAKKKSAAGGGKFSWSPKQFEDVCRAVGLARSRSKPFGVGMLEAMARTIVSQGPLACPAPETDPEGKYRVVLDANGIPEIQKQSADGLWAKVWP